MSVFSPRIFAVAGFLFQGFAVFGTPGLVENQVSGGGVIFAQLVLILLSLIFMIFQIYHRDADKRHIASLVFGSVLFWIMVSFIYETQGMIGMSLVAVVVWVLLIKWKRMVLVVANDR